MPQEKKNILIFYFKTRNLTFLTLPRDGKRDNETYQDRK